MFSFRLFVAMLIVVPTTSFSQNPGRILKTEAGQCKADTRFQAKYYIDTDADDNADQLVIVGCNNKISFSDPQMFSWWTEIPVDDSSQVLAEFRSEQAPSIELSAADNNQRTLEFYTYEAGKHSVIITTDEISPQYISSNRYEFEFVADGMSKIILKLNGPLTSVISAVNISRPNKRSDFAPFEIAKF